MTNTEMHGEKPILSDTRRLELLQWPHGKVDAVLDTDTYNEIDDQFALVYTLLAADKINLQAVYAAPFHNDRSEGPADGMEKSFEEIIRVLQRMGHQHSGFAFKGSARWLDATLDPVACPAVDDLIARARLRKNRPLYVIAIGAITNVASALLAAPDIADKIVVLWLGGHPLHWQHTREFNLQGDLIASQVLFDSGAALVRFPCLLVTEQLRTSLNELDLNVRRSGKIGAYLYDICRDYRDGAMTEQGATKVIWDIASIAWLVNPNWITTALVHSPILTDSLTWSEDRTRHMIREVLHIQRDPVFADFFSKLHNASR